MVKLEFLSNIWRKKTLFFGIIIILLLLIGANYIFNLSSSKKKATPFVTYPSKGEYIHGQVIVAFRDGYVPKQLEEEIESEKNRNFLGKLEATLKNEKKPEKKLNLIKNNLGEIGVTDYKPEFDGSSDSLNKFYILYYDSKISIETIQDRLKKISFLESSEPNSVMHIFVIPNDTYYSQLWGMQKIQAPQAWDITTGSTSIVVADIDTGVDLSHPDLSVNLVPGWNFINNTNIPQDDVGHGTHVAGTIGGVGNNGTGVVGVNWNVKIMPIKVMDSSGSGTGSTIMQAVKYAADRGARVANLSLGGHGVCSSSQQSVINYAISKGVVLAIAAGNDHIDAANDQPGNCNGVITVGASTSSDTRASFSNYGSTVEIAAPGTDIFSTILPGAHLNGGCYDAGGGYGPCSGTSMAAPHVAGAVALLLSANPNLSPAEVSKCLIDNADSISTDRPIGPRLNIFKAISACGGGSIPTLPATTSTPTPTLTLTPTPTPTTPVINPTPQVTKVPSSSSSINVFVYVDNDNSGGFTAGDTAYIGANIYLSGCFVKTLQTDSSGNALFSSVPPGNCVLRIGIPILPNTFGPYPVTLASQQQANFIFGIPRSMFASLTPTPTLTPIPTQTPVPTQSIPGSSPTPTPIPQTTYNCVIDQTNCPQGQKNLQLCPLKCTPI